MSFFCNFQSDRCPGVISGNPLNGMCEKVCVTVSKVFDACMQQTQLSGVVLNLTDLTPENPTYPLTFVSAKNSTNEGIISNLQVTPLPERPKCSRVKFDLTIPVTVAYTDANGVEGVGVSSVTILSVPKASITPYDVKSNVSLVSTIGTYTGENQFTVECCISVIVKIVMDVDLLIPSYGYVAMPPCQDYNEEVCQGFFELPVYPEQ